MSAVNIKSDVSGLVGSTPMVYLDRVCAGLPGRVCAKLEMMNPMSSVKDRIGLSMIVDAEKKGLLKKGDWIVEATSGNTGIALAMLASARGYKCCLAMPASMSMERRIILKAFGATLLLSDPKFGMKGALATADRFVAARKEAGEGVWMAKQFENEANPAAHVEGTGPEIWADTAGGVDCLVSGVGTGGTLTGAGGYLKGKKAGVHVVAVEPVESPVLSGGKPSPHKIQGIGAGFIPDVLDKTMIDSIEQVSSDDAIAMARRLAAEEGILAGISSGAAAVAARRVAERPEMKGKLIVVVFPSCGERYLTSALYDAEREAAAALPIEPGPDA